MPCPRPLFSVILFSYLLPLAPSEVPSSPAASLRFVSPSFQHASSQAAVPPDGGTALPGIVSSLPPLRSPSRHAVGGRRRLQARLYADVSPHGTPVWQPPPAASGPAEACNEPSRAASASPSTAGWAVRRLHGREPAGGASVDLGAGSGASARGWVDDGGDVWAGGGARELADAAAPGTGGMGGAPFAGPVEMAEDESDDIDDDPVVVDRIVTPPPPVPPVLTGHVSPRPPVLTGHVTRSSDDIDDDPEGMDVVAVCHPPFRPPRLGLSGKVLACALSAPWFVGARALTGCGAGSARARCPDTRGSASSPWRRPRRYVLNGSSDCSCNARAGWRGG